MTEYKSIAHRARLSHEDQVALRELRIMDAGLRDGASIGDPTSITGWTPTFWSKRPLGWQELNTLLLAPVR